MGCVCAKGISSAEKAEIKREKAVNRLSRRFVASSRKDDVVVLGAEAAVGNDVSKVRLISKPQENAAPTSPMIFDDGGNTKREHAQVVVDAPLLQKKRSGPKKKAVLDTSTGEAELNSRITQVPNGVHAEHVAAGWPSWLVSVAGDAINGWIPRKANSFERLDKIGQGTYSNVYKARDLETGKLVALKKVRFVNMDPESVRFMAREIYVLRRLDHPNIVKLEGLIASKMSCSLYLVFEYMEHDLAGLAASPAIKFSESQVKCYMQQLLHGLDHCHGRGVLHRDIKGSNLLIDNNGILKIADFGLATFFSPDKMQPLTSRVITLWYRPPELLLGATEYGVAVDMWSTGCILAELLAGKPIMPGRTEVEQLHKIFKLCGSPPEEYWRKSKLPHATIFKPQHPYRRCIQDVFKDFPSPALALLEVLLAVEPANRGTAASALHSEYFNTKPFACDPSSLPKYPPSKEFDAKLRDEESRRQKAMRIKGRGSESIKRVPKESKAVLEKLQTQANQKSSSYKYNTLEDSASGLSIDHPNGTTQNGSLWCKKTGDDEHRTAPIRSLSNARVSFGPELKTQRSYLHRAGDTSNFSGLLTTGNGRADSQRKNSHWPEHRSGYHQLDAAETSEKKEWTHHLLDRPTSSNKNEERAVVKESTSAFNTKKNRIHYSGPLISQRDNLDEMLREHERQIQQAVRKARIEKGSVRNNYG